MSNRGGLIEIERCFWRRIGVVGGRLVMTEPPLAARTLVHGAQHLAARGVIGQGQPADVLLPDHLSDLVVRHLRQQFIQLDDVPRRLSTVGA